MLAEIKWTLQTTNSEWPARRMSWRPSGLQMSLSSSTFCAFYERHNRLSPDNHTDDRYVCVIYSRHKTISNCNSCNRPPMVRRRDRRRWFKSSSV